MAMKVRYTTINGEVIAEKRNGSRRLYVPDPLGSTVALLDNTQTQVDTFTYWPYGEGRTSTGTTPPPFQFVGTQGYYSDGTGRTYVRARHLHTQKGRWLTEDPIGFDGGDWNLYRYVNNYPQSWSDPTGLFHIVFTRKKPTHCGTLTLVTDPGDFFPENPNRSRGTISKGGDTLLTCKACNNIFATGPGKNDTHIYIPKGTYPIGPPEYRGPMTGPNYNPRVGPWYIPINGGGPGGGFVDSGGKNHPDTGIHGGRQNPGGPGYTHGTYGCIRLEDKCLDTLARLINHPHMGRITITVQ